MKVICVLALGIFAAQAAEVTPVQKVITLLSGMLEKGKLEKHEEQLVFAKSKQVCSDTSAVKVAAITDEEETIDSLDAMIEHDTVTSASLLRMIKELDADQDVWSADIKAAQKVRNIEKADYATKHQDYSESIDAMQHAIAVLKKETHDRKQKGSFVQALNMDKLGLMVPPSAKKAIDAFLQTSGENKDMSDIDTAGAPEANAYEFQSSGIIDILEKLLDKFVDERTEAEKEEANSKNAHDMLLQELKAEIEEAGRQSSSKSEQNAEVLSAKATETGDLHDEETTHTADETYLKDLKADCTMKESDFEARQQLRAEEIESIEKAIAVLSSDAVSGASEKHLPQLLQIRKKAVLTQLRSNLNTQLEDRVLKMFQERAHKLNSRILSLVAVKMQEDPFNKVKKMLKDLIVRLMEEANEESEHKGWCDTEMSTNEQTRKEKTQEVETLHAHIDQLEASVSKLTEDINDLTKAVAELDSAMAKATNIRQEESKQNAATVKDATEAQTALAQASSVLKEFYAKAGEATAFLQAEPFKGNQEGMGGVMGMLEVIESDFARLEAETQAAEATAQKEYDQFLEDSKVDKASKSTDMEHKTAKKQDQSQALTVQKSDLEGTQKELDAALAFFDKLKPSCVDSGVSYEDRVARRKEEIESMQEGLKILNGEDIA